MKRWLAIVIVFAFLVGCGGDDSANESDNLVENNLVNQGQSNNGGEASDIIPTETPVPLPTPTEAPTVKTGKNDLITWKWFYSDGVFAATAMAWSPVENILAVGQKNGNVLLWDVAANELLDIFVGQSGRIVNLAWSENGDLLASGSETDGKIMVWSKPEGGRYKTLTGHTDGNLFLEWSGNDVLLSGSLDNTIKTWDVENEQVVSEYIQTDNSLGPIAWSPDRNQIAVGNGLQLTVLEAGSGELLQILDLPGKEKNNSVALIEWSPDGKMLASGNRACCDIENTAIWNTEDWTQVKSLDARVIAWSSDSNYFSYAAGNTPFQYGWYIWSPAADRINTIREASGPYYDIDWTNDGFFLVSADRYEAPIYAKAGWEMKFSLQENYGYGTDKEDFRQVKWSFDNTFLAARDKAGLVVIWRTLLDPATTLPQTFGEGDSDWVNIAAWSPDGKQIARAGGNQIIVSDPTAESENLTLETGKSAQVIVTTVDWSPDGVTILGADNKGNLYVWNAESGTLLWEVEGHSDWVYSIAVSPSGEKVVSVSHDQTIKVWDPNTWENTNTKTGFGSAVISLAWAPDGSMFATGTESGRVDIWGGVNETGLYSFDEHDSPVHSLAWSPDSQRLAAGSWDQDILLVNPVEKEIIQSLRGTTLAWSPLDQYLVTGMRNGDIVLWDAQIGNFLDILHGHEDWVYSLIWSPNGEYLFSGGRDGAFGIWLIQNPE